MPEDVGGEGQDGQAAAKSPMISGKGWAIVALVIILEAALFSIVLFVKQSDPKTAEADWTPKGDTVKYMNLYNVKLTDFTKSVMGSGSQMLTLLIAMDIQLGRTPAEIRDGKLPTNADMLKFQDAVKALLPSVRNLLIDKINTMNAALLNKHEGMQMIANAVKDHINERLRMLTLELEDKDLDRNRVQAINFETFILQ